MEFREHTLGNGMQVVAECNPRAYSLALGFFVNAGARDENDANSGVSHFLEHMAFKGTARRSAEQVNRELDEMGSQSNAFTSEENTAYYATVLPEFMAPAVDLLADILRPALREEDFHTEKQVILEEILKYEDQPPFGANERGMAAYFGRHPLARPVLGTVDSVSGLTPEAMRSYFEDRYSPANIVLVASGQVNFEALVRLAEEHCGRWERRETSRTPERAEENLGLLVMTKEQATQAYAVQLADGPAAEDEDRFAARVAGAIFGDESGSRLFWELVDTGRAEYAAVGSYEFQGTGLHLSYLCSDPETICANLADLHRLQQEFRRDGAKEEELELALNKICASVVLSAERPTSRLFAVGGNWIQRREYRTIAETVAAYQAVTLPAISALLEKYDYTRNLSVVVGPETWSQLLGFDPRKE